MLVPEVSAHKKMPHVKLLRHRTEYTAVPPILVIFHTITHSFMFQQTPSLITDKAPVDPFPGRPHQIHSLTIPILPSHHRQLSQTETSVNYYFRFIGFSIAISKITIICLTVNTLVHKSENHLLFVCFYSSVNVLTL